MTPTVATFDIAGLKDYQAPVSSSLFHGIQKHGVQFDASDTGIGKTYTAGGFLRGVSQQLASRFFVICPKVVRHDWKVACDHFGIKPFGLVNYEKLVRGNTPFVKWKRVMSGKIMNKNGTVKKKSEDVGYYKWRLPMDTVIVFDEVHKCKGFDSLNGKLLQAAKNQGYKIHSMSATAATNPTEMFSLGYALGLHDGNVKNFRQWCLDHGCEWTGRFGAMSFDHKSSKAMGAMKAIHHELMNTGKMVRISREVLGDRFPKSVITADAVDCGDQTNKINKVYDVMEMELALLEKKSENYSAHQFAIMMKARRMAELLKVPTFVEMAILAVEQGKSVPIFVNFQDTVTALAKRLKKYKISFIVGGQSQTERDADVALFQSGENPILIANIAAGGVGVSLHDLTGEHERHALISPCFSAIQMVQALGRSWRQGGGWSRQQIVFAGDTIEERACHKVRAKITNINLLNDGDFQAGIKF